MTELDLKTLVWTRGERFPKEDDDAKPAQPKPADASVLAASNDSDAKAKDEKKEVEPYRDARASVTLGAGESATVTIHCDFDPALVLVDPDARVLQLERKKAIFRF